MAAADGELSDSVHAAAAQRVQHGANEGFLSARSLSSAPASADVRDCPGVIVSRVFTSPIYRPLLLRTSFAVYTDYRALCYSATYSSEGHTEWTAEDCNPRATLETDAGKNSRRRLVTGLQLA